MQLKLVYIGLIVVFITLLLGSPAVCIEATTDVPLICGGYTPDQCNGQCVNLQTDVQNCGTCGNTCDTGEICQNGQCVSASGSEEDTNGDQEESADDLRGIRVPTGEILTAQPTQELIPQPVDEGLTPVGDETPAAADTDAGTGAQDQGLDVIQPGVGGLRGVGGLDRPGTLVERRYKVEAISFHCYGETWYDNLGSDEIGISIHGITFNNKFHHNIMLIGFEDVDAGETRTFPSNKRCILPINAPPNEGFSSARDIWTCLGTGVPGPFSFIVEMRELDGPFSYDYIFSSEDDLIGERTLAFTPEELAAAMPNVYDTYDETIRLGPCYDERGCITSPGTPEDPDYSFTYRLTRLPDYMPTEVSPGSGS